MKKLDNELLQNLSDFLAYKPDTKKGIYVHTKKEVAFNNEYNAILEYDAIVVLFDMPDTINSIVEFEIYGLPTNIDDHTVIPINKCLSAFSAEYFETPIAKLPLGENIELQIKLTSCMNLYTFKDTYIYS